MTMKKTLALVLAVCMMIACVPAMAEEAAATYTYNMATDPKNFPTTWNPHQYKTANDNDLAMSYLSDALYGFDYNEAGDSYALVPRMAVGDPVDVTADYIGDEWGIPEGATARAWKVTIRDDLKWQDGTPITAQTWVESAKLQLNPKAQNYRADSLYSGSMVLHNAEAYVKGGVEADTSFRAYMEATGAADMESFLAEHGEEKGYINWNGSYGDTYDFEAQTWTGAAENAIVETPLTVKELYDFFTTGKGAEYCTWATDEQKLEWAYDELFAKYTAPAVDFETVGIKALSDTEIVFILDKTLEGFYLKYTMDVPLVHVELYNKCATETDGVYTNNYGTSVETSMSYGAWKMVEFQSDKIIAFEKNENWYGYALPENEGLYQTTRIQIDAVAEAATRVEMFLNGKLDQVGLNKDYMAEYATSDYTYYDESPSTFAMAFNPDMDALKANQAAAGENINKTILTVKEFRMAMSLGIDRAKFCLATSPTNAPAFALYGETIIANPETAEFYRSTDAAKQVVVDFWGLGEDVGEGKLYATVDDALAAISGYAPEMAQEYFNVAYDKAIEQGLMDEDDVVQIIIGLPSASSAFYNGGYDYIVNNYTELVKGTKLEGKLTFTRDDTIGNGFGDALRNNQVDMLFGVGWTGAEFDPFSLMEAYVSSNYVYDACWDATKDMMDVTVDGVTYTASVYEWYESINNTPITATVTGTDTTAELVFPYSLDEAEAEKRVTVLAALENVVLQNYDFIPLMNDASAKLKGMQIEYYTEDEIFPLSRGGVKYMTYNYTDAEWDAYVAEQGGTLNYK